MKTIIAFVAATIAVAGASGAAANEFQASDEAASYALSHAPGWSFGGAYDSARVPGSARNSTVSTPTQTDVQAGGNN
jgi:hypothetical protein